MRHLPALLCLLPLSLTTVATAEIHPLSLRQALERAVDQNPDVALSKLDELQAEARVKLERDPFTTKIVVGSGLAYTSGFPLSIEGSAPSILQARAIRSIFDRPASYRVAQRREELRTAGLATERQKEQVAARVAGLWLDARYLKTIEDLVARRVASVEKAGQWTRARVEEGLLLPVEQKKAELRLAQARHEARVTASDRAQVESALAGILGYPAEDRVTAAEGAPEPQLGFSTIDEAIAAAARVNPELRRLESALASQELALRSAESQWMPKVDLVAQYALLGRFNNYADFFNRFERHNYQIGASFQLPVRQGTAAEAQLFAAAAEKRKLQLALERETARMAREIRRLYGEMEELESAAAVARLDLEVSGQELSIAEARFEEGRAPERELEDLRLAVSRKQAALEQVRLLETKARIELLAETGPLLQLIP